MSPATWAMLPRICCARKVASAALDVFENEPLAADSLLLDPDIEDRCRVFPHFASAGRITRLSTDPEKGMAGRCVQGLLDVLEGNYPGNITRMPYVVNKEASASQGFMEKEFKKGQRRAVPSLNNPGSATCRMVCACLLHPARSPPVARWVRRRRAFPPVRASPNCQHRP